MPVLHVTDDGVNSVPLVYWLMDAPDDAVGLRQLLAGKRHLQIANAVNNAGHVAGLRTLGKPVSEQHGFLLPPKAP